MESQVRALLIQLVSRRPLPPATLRALPSLAREAEPASLGRCPHMFGIASAKVTTSTASIRLVAGGCIGKAKSKRVVRSSTSPLSRKAHMFPSLTVVRFTPLIFLLCLRYSAPCDCEPPRSSNLYPGKWKSYRYEGPGYNFGPVPLKEANGQSNVEKPPVYSGTSPQIIIGCLDPGSRARYVCRGQ